MSKFSKNNENKIGDKTTPCFQPKEKEQNATKMYILRSIEKWFSSLIKETSRRKPVVRK